MRATTKYVVAAKRRKTRKNRAATTKYTKNTKMLFFLCILRLFATEIVWAKAARAGFFDRMNRIVRMNGTRGQGPETGGRGQRSEFGGLGQALTNRQESLRPTRRVGGW